MTDDEIQSEALRILKILTDTPFEQCCPVTKEFSELPPRLGLYAVRHREEGVLYIGKAGNVRNRFMGGHKAIQWAYVEHLAIDDIRIVAVVVSSQWRRSLLELETLMLQSIKPRYNIKIRSED
jgi:excinuclease UvrABC nuclease subunit